MTENTQAYDAIIIGSGKGGKTLAGALSAQGKRVALIEQSRAMYGGTCINVACIPTKSLVNSARLSAEQGGTFEARAARYAEAIARKGELTGMLRQKNYRKAADAPGVDVVDGTARFVDDTHVAVEGAAGSLVLEGSQVFINTGSRPFVPAIPGLAESARVYTSETLLEMTELPRTLAIIGGGYIGVEFASIFADFGSQVTVIQDGDRFLPREDAEVAAVVLASLENRSVTVMRGAQITGVQGSAAEAAIALQVEGAACTVAAEAVLVATGRRPNIEGLNLEAAGVEVTERGAVKVDEHLHTSAPNIYAMGDVAGGLQFTYISLDDFRIVKSALMGDGSRTTRNRGAVPYSVFVDPPFSRVGMTEDEARAAGYNVKVGTLPAAAIPKAQVLRKPVGLLKAVVDADTDLILGAHLFCEESHEMINTVKLAVDARIPYSRLRDAIYTHPTMSEAFNDLFAAVK